VSIKNQPFDNRPFGSSVTFSLYYNVRTKGHFEADNWTVLDQNETVISNEEAGESWVLGVKPSNYSNTVLSYPADYPPTTQVDFQVQAAVYQWVEVYVPIQPLSPSGGSYYLEPELYETTNWSSTQTVIILANIPLSPAPTSTSSTSVSSASYALLLLIALIVIAFLLAVIIFLVLYIKKRTPLTQDTRLFPTANWIHPL
jgi:hypothetical protein